ncbi:MAG: YceI family protein [Hellea sp.]
MFSSFKNIIFISVCCINFLLVACQSKPLTAWNLLSSESKINYVSVKNNDLMENNSFEIFEGFVGLDGKAELIIDLNSVNTNNDIRDERMREILFKTETHPFAKITALLDLSDYEKLSIGSSLVKNLDFNFSFQGLSSTYEAKIEVYRLSVNKVLVKSVEPIFIYGDDYDLYPGLQKLQKLAGLDSITPVVPVIVSLIFER